MDLYSETQFSDYRSTDLNMNSRPTFSDRPQIRSNIRKRPAARSKTKTNFAKNTLTKIFTKKLTPSRSMANEIKQTLKKPKNWNRQLGGDWNQHVLAIRDIDNFETATVRGFSRDRLLMMKIPGSVPGPVLAIDTQQSFNKNKKIAVMTLIHPLKTSLVFKQDVMPLQVGISKYYPQIDSKHVKLPHVLNSLKEANRYYDEVLEEVSEIDAFKYVANLKPKRDKGNYSRTCQICGRFFPNLANKDRHVRTFHKLHEENSYLNMKESLARLENSKSLRMSVRQRSCHEKAIDELKKKIAEREAKGFTKQDKRDMGEEASETDSDPETPEKRKKIKRVLVEEDDDGSEIGIVKRPRKRARLLSSSSEEENDGQDEFVIEGEPQIEQVEQIEQIEEVQTEQEDPSVENDQPELEHNQQESKDEDFWETEVKLEPDDCNDFQRESRQDDQNEPLEPSGDPNPEDEKGCIGITCVSGQNGLQYLECNSCKMRFDKQEQLVEHLENHEHEGMYAGEDNSDSEDAFGDYVNHFEKDGYGAKLQI